MNQQGEAGVRLFPRYVPVLVSPPADNLVGSGKQQAPFVKVIVALPVLKPAAQPGPVGYFVKAQHVRRVRGTLLHGRMGTVEQANERVQRGR